MVLLAMMVALCQAGLATLTQVEEATMVQRIKALMMAARIEKYKAFRKLPQEKMWGYRIFT